MKALVYTAPRRVEIQDLPRPEPRPGEVLLRVALTGVCGSDIHGFLGKSERRKPGLVLGHEAVATVAQVHPGVSGWEPGRRAVVNPLLSCGACPSCLAGRQNLCSTWQLLGMDRRQGTYAEYVAVPAAQLYPVSDTLPDAAAVLAEPLANVVHFYRISVTETPETAAILGVGTIGTLALLLGRLRGIGKIVVLDRNADRLRTARELGADLALDTREPGAIEEARRFLGDGAEYVVEAAGHAESRRAAVALCRKGGRIVFIGMADMETSLPWIEMIRDEKAVLTTFGYTPRDFAAALRLLEAGRIRLDRWTEIRPLEEGQEAFVKIADAPGNVLKMAFRL
jgi:threonine dehydrogenase-like Zn-dependent dehydrogenase